MTAQTARAIHDDAPRLIHHRGDFETRQIRHGFDVRLQRFLLARRQQSLAQPPETPSIRLRTLAHFPEMAVLIEVEIQPVIKPRRHQAKGESDQRSGEADGRRETHFAASFGKSFRKASRSVSATRGRRRQFATKRNAPLKIAAPTPGSGTATSATSLPPVETFPTLSAV